MTTLVVTGAIILFLDWIARNAAEALGDEAPGLNSGGEGPGNGRTPGNDTQHSTRSVSHPEEPPL